MMLWEFTALKIEGGVTKDSVDFHKLSSSISSVYTREAQEVAR